MSLMSRALGGAGQAIADVSSNYINKYLDTQAQNERAQFLSDLQMKNTKALDDYQLSDERQSRVRGAAAASAREVGAATNEVALAGKVAEATNPDMQNADVQRAGRVASATASATAEAQAAAVAKNGNDPTYLKGARNMALAGHIESAASVAQAALAQEQLKITKTVATLRQQVSAAVAGGDEKAEKTARDQLDVYLDKGSKAEKYAAVLERTSNNNAAAMKVLADPMAPPEAKKTAQDEIERNNVISREIAKKAGITLPEAQAAQPPQGAVDYLTKNPATAAQFDAKYGQGASQRVLAGSGAPTPSKTPAAAAAPAAAPEVTPPSSPSGKFQARQRSLAEEAQRGTAEKTAQATAALAALQPGDAQGADALQRGPLFGYLTPEQKQQVFALVSGR